MAQRVIAVTGANRGMGLALAKKLAAGEKGVSHVVLCSRDMKKGLEARDSLGKVKAEVDVVELDMDSEESMDQFCLGVKEKYGKLHGLLNNAAINIKDPKYPKDKLFQKTAKTNLFGPVWLSEELIQKDLIERNGKILSTSWTMALSKFIIDEKLNKILGEINSCNGFDSAYNYILENLKEGNHEKLFRDKAPIPEYMSLKLLLSKYCKILSQDDNILKRDIFVASVCPGWCKTEMGGSNAPNTVESGAEVSYELFTQDLSAKSPLQGQLVQRGGKGKSV